MIVLRYLGRQIYTAVLAIVSILLFVMLISQMTRYLNKSAQGLFTPEVVFKAVVLGVPLFLTYLIPLALLLGATVVIGRMSADHELVTLHACGYSRAKLFYSMILVSVPVFLFMAALTFYVSPGSEKLERTLIARAVMTASLDKMLPGQFQTFGKSGSIFFADHQSSDKQLQDVLFVTPMEKKNNIPAPLLDIVRAESIGSGLSPDGEPAMIFHQGRKAILQAGNKVSHVFDFQDYGIRLAPPTHTAIRKPWRTLNINELWRMRNKDLSYQAEFQWRMVLPLSVIVLTLITIPLSGVNPRSGKFMRIIPAVLFYAIYINFLICSRSWVESGRLTPNIGLWWVPTLSLLLLLFWAGGRSIRMRLQRRQYATN